MGSNQKNNASRSLLATRAERMGAMGLILAAAVVAQFLSDYHLTLLMTITIYALAGMGLNLLMGNTGLISIAHAAFMGVGAFSSAYLIHNVGLPVIPSVILAGLITSVVGMVFGLPSLRLKGVYLAMASFAAQVILYWAFEQSRWLTGGQDGRFVDRPTIFGISFFESEHLYLLILLVTVIGAVVNLNILRSRLGRAFAAVRDRTAAAELLGVNVFRTKMVAFGLSTFYAGVAGAMFGFYLEFVAIQAFQLLISIQFLVLVIIGGLGRVSGSILGAAFIVLIPEALDTIVLWVSHESGPMAPIRVGMFGFIVVVFLIYEPHGLARTWRRMVEWGIARLERAG
jgi:branched-chain amino acid transport system permease protein